MTDEHSSISRRNVLAGLGTIGVGGALVGAGTSAFFSDEQQLPNEMVAGELQLSLDFQEKYDFGEGMTPIDAFPDTDETDPGVKDHDFYEDEVCGKLLDEDPINSKKYRTENEWTDPGDPLINLDDIKPGDCGKLSLSYHLCDNDGWIWFRTKNKEYPDDPSELHLVDAIEAKVWYDTAGDGYYDENEDLVIVQGSLRDVLEELNESEGGMLLDPEPTVVPEEHKSGECRALETVDDDWIRANYDGYDDEDDVMQTFIRDREGETITFEDDGTEVKITITELIYQDEGDTDSDVVGFEWESNYGICQTRFKGGPDQEGVVIEEECATAGSGTTPRGAGGPNDKRFGLSNFQFWYCKDDPDPPEPECFEASTTYYLGFEWCLPAEVGNEVQRDELEFDFGFYTEQCRHNDDPQAYWESDD